VRPAGEEPFVLSVCTTIDLAETEAAALVAEVARDVWRAEHPDAHPDELVDPLADEQGSA
jgi:beta-lactamase class A